MQMAAFGSICSLQNGRAFKPSEWSEKGTPIIRIQNLNDESAPFNYCRFDVEKRFHVNTGDLLFSWSGTPGTSFGAFFWRRGKAFLNQHIFRVDVDENKISKDYLRYAINGKLDEIIGQAHGGVGLKHITKGKLEAVEMYLPPIETQKYIARVLEQADQLRKQAQQMENELNQLAQSLFLDMFGDYRSISSDRFVPLSSVADVVSGVAKGNSLKGKKTQVVPYLRVANVQDGYLDLSEIKLIEATEREIQNYVLQAGDILMTEGGDYDKLGRGAMWSDEIQKCIHQNHIFRVRLSGKYVPKYFEYYLRSPMAKMYFLRCAKKTTNLASINMTQLKALPTPIETREKQNRFVTALQGIENQLQIVKYNKGAFEEVFQSLIQRAFKGELTPKTKTKAA